MRKRCMVFINTKINESKTNLIMLKNMKHILIEFFLHEYLKFAHMHKSTKKKE